MKSNNNHTVWNCGSDDGSKCFLLRKIKINFFYVLKIIFDISTSKRSEKKSKFKRIRFVSRFQTHLITIVKRVIGYKIFKNRSTSF